MRGNQGSLRLGQGVGDKINTVLCKGEMDAVMRGTQGQLILCPWQSQKHCLTVLFLCPLAENATGDLATSRNAADSSVPSGRFLKRPAME
ncbi:hypothetical protein H8959_008915 [Pygathrix nigripes]